MSIVLMTLLLIEIIIVPGIAFLILFKQKLLRLLSVVILCIRDIFSLRDYNRFAIIDVWVF